MSVPDSDLSSHDERQLRRPTERSTVARWLDDVFYYGVAQVLLLGLLALWTVLQTPYVDLSVKSAVVIAAPVIVLAVGTLRSGVVTVGRPWPRIDGSRLGTGEGYQAYVTRAAYLSATLLGATYGGAFVSLATDSVLVGSAVAGVVAAVLVALFPHLTAPGRYRRLGRAAVYLAGFGVAFALSSPLDTSVGDPFVLVYFLILGALAAFDLSARGWRNAA
jgi:hypothetical protein